MSGMAYCSYVVETDEMNHYGKQSITINQNKSYLEEKLSKSHNTGNIKQSQCNRTVLAHWYAFCIHSVKLGDKKIYLISDLKNNFSIMIKVVNIIFQSQY